MRIFEVAKSSNLVQHSNQAKLNTVLIEFMFYIFRKNIHRKIKGA